MDRKNFGDIMNIRICGGWPIYVGVEGRRPVCWICGEAGHLSKACPVKRQEDQQKIVIPKDKVDEATIPKIDNKPGKWTEAVKRGGVKNTTATHQQEEVKTAEKQEEKPERKKEQQQQPSSKQAPTGISAGAGGATNYTRYPYGRHASIVVLIFKNRERGRRRRRR